MDDGLRSIKEFPDIPFLYYEAKSWHSWKQVYASFLFVGVVNIALIALYISAIIWIVRGLT